jgi:hypothetical protein
LTKSVGQPYNTRYKGAISHMSIWTLLECEGGGGIDKPEYRVLCGFPLEGWLFCTPFIYVVYFWGKIQFPCLSFIYIIMSYTYRMKVFNSV